MPDTKASLPTDSPGKTLDDKALRLPLPLYQPFKLSFSVRYKIYAQSIQDIISDFYGDEDRAVNNPVIIFPPSLDWNSQLFQRPQQLALALARKGALIFYVQPPTSYRKTEIQNPYPRLFLCNLPTGSFFFQKNPLIYLLTWNAKYQAAFNEPRIIYDYVDNLAAFQGKRNQITRQHNQLLKQANWILTTAVRLYEQALNIRHDALLCPNGVDYQFILQARNDQPIPADLIPILDEKKPVVGYYGALSHWFDYDLLIKVASIRQDLSFILIGSDPEAELKKSSALQLSNIFWLGRKAYTEIPRYLHFFDVGIIPFSLSEVTHATSPLKLFEYMAGGKPVVTTAMEESQRYPGVLIGHDPHEFSQKLSLALQLAKDADYLQKIDQVARENTWDQRATQILAALQSTQKKS